MTVPAFDLPSGRPSSCHHGGRHLLHVHPLLPRLGRLHQSQRSVSLGPVDRLRRDVASCWRPALHPDAAVEIFNIKRFHSIIRPTILTAFLGYLLVSAALMYDLGLPWNIWHPLVMRNRTR